MQNQSSKITSAVTKTYPNGKPKEIIYFCEGKQIAKEIINDSNKNRIVRQIPDKLVCEYDEEGNLKAEYYYKNNRHHGKWKIYNKGVLSIEGKMVNGEPNGIFKHYYPSSILQGKWRYKKGKLEGVCTTYNEDGTIKDLLLFKNGKLIGKIGKVKAFFYKLQQGLKDFCILILTQGISE